MSNAFARFAFNAAVATTNAAHMTKRGAVKTAKVTAGVAVVGTVATVAAATAATVLTAKGVAATGRGTINGARAFWAGMKYAHQYNKANAAAAERLTPEDIEASKPKTAKTRMVAKR